MALDVAAFQKRLDENSEYKGVPFGRVHLIFEAEEEHAQACLKYNGYLHLSDAFKCHFLEAVELLNTEVRPKVKSPLSEFYPLFMARLAHSFRTLCGAERVSLRGYPYHGYALLRNTFDNLLMTSAALQKVTDFYALEGIEPGKEIDPVQIKKRRKLAEWHTTAVMTGAKSGLSEKTISEVAIWDAMFDYETHGARLSVASAMGWMKGTEPLPVVPKFSESAFAIFVNRYCEIGWMTHRLVPLIQSPDAALPDSWKKKWRVIDESFEIMVNSLTEQSGKAIGAAIVELVKAKFPFNESGAFPL